jgi:hypothetical protein
MATSHPPKIDTHFSSIEEMQLSHAALAKEVSNVILSPEHLERITRFVRRALATGTLLDAREDRVAAQSLINFWTARLESAARDLRGSVSRSVPPGPSLSNEPLIEDTLLPEFDPETIRSGADAAERWLEMLPEDDRRVAGRIMLRLVRLGSSSRSFEPVPTTRAALQEVDPSSAKVDAAISQLAADGMIRVTKGNTTETDQVSLRDESLMITCSYFKKWLRERTSFRETVEAWDRGGRPKEALFSGDALEQARSYNDRNPIERLFTEESRREEIWLNERNRRLKKFFGGLACLAVIALLVTSLSAYKWRVYYKLAQQSADDLARANMKAKVRGDQLTEKQRLTEMTALVRSLALIGTGSEAERDIAVIRLEATRKFLEGRPEIQDFFAKHETTLQAILEKRASEADLKALQLAALNLARDYKEKVLKGSAPEDFTKSLSEERDVIFTTVQSCADRIVKMAEQDKPYHEADPYLKEFWILYWGEMGLVERGEVARAMAQFGSTLRRIDQRIADQIHSSESFKKDPSALRGLTNRQAVQSYFDEARVFAKSKLNPERGAGVGVDLKTELPQLRQELEALHRAIEAERQQPLRLEQPLSESY